MLTEAHAALVARYTGGRDPDVTIAPDGTDYIFRWHLVLRNEDANVYFHVQVASDPERPLHDHPWQNTSIILANGYDELMPWSGCSHPGPGIVETPAVSPRTTLIRREVGDVIHRTAEQAHRLILRDPYSISLFITGPKTRSWGFWTTGQGGFPLWVDHRHVIETRDGKSTYIGPRA